MQSLTVYMVRLVGFEPAVLVLRNASFQPEEMHPLPPYNQ